jgi:hypothetical protein
MEKRKEAQYRLGAVQRLREPKRRELRWEQ